MTKKIIFASLISVLIFAIAILNHKKPETNFNNRNFLEISGELKKLDIYAKQVKKGENAVFFNYKKALRDGFPKEIVMLQKETFDCQNEMLEKFKVGLGNLFDPIDSKKYPRFAEYNKIENEYYTEYHKNKKREPSDRYLTMDLRDIERQTREMEPYVKYVKKDGVRLQVFDEKAARKDRKPDETILLVKEIVTCQNEMMKKIKAGRTDVFGQVDAKKYPRITKWHKSATNYHKRKKREIGDRYLTMDLRDIERQTREMEPYVKYIEKEGVRLQVFDEKAAKKDRKPEETILLVKEIVAYQNEMMKKIKAGKTNVFGQMDAKKYPRIAKWNEAATNFHNIRDGKIKSEYQPCGVKDHPVPDSSPAREYYTSENSQKALLDLGFHHTASYACGEYGKNCSDKDFTRGRDYYGDYGYCDSPIFRDHGYIGGEGEYSIQCGEPNPEIHNYEWPYITWPIYVDWWHAKY